GAANVDSRLAEDRAFVWVDGVPVSYVGTSTPAGGIVRIGPVYTPPERRGRGYASALVALVSQRALDGGAVACSLYAHPASPTSTRSSSTPTSAARSSWPVRRPRSTCSAMGVSSSAWGPVTWSGSTRRRGSPSTGAASGSSAWRSRSAS